MTSLIGIGAAGSLPSYKGIMQAIRDAAGVPSTETTGVRYDESLIGCDETITLTDTSALAINAESVIANAADSGTGTALDPYILQNRLFAETGSTSQPLNWTHSAADYYIKCVNCVFEGYSVAHTLRLNNVPSGAGIEFENCTIRVGTSSTTSTSAFAIVTSTTTAASVEFDRCWFQSVGANVFNISQAYGGTLWVHDCLFTEESAWLSTANSLLRNASTTACTVLFEYNTVRGTQGSIDYLFRPNYAATSFIVRNNNCSGYVIGFYQGIGTPTAGPMDVYYNVFDTSEKEHIYMHMADGHNIYNNDFIDSGAQFRIIYYSDTLTTLDNVENVNVYRNKFTKTTGTPGVAQNEVVYFYGTGTSIAYENWTTECTEDNIEFTIPRSGCEFRYNVGDNVYLQNCDIFNDPLNAVLTIDTVVTGSFGTCGTDLVNLSNVQGARVQLIYGSGDRSALSFDDEVNNTVVYGPIVNESLIGALYEDASLGSSSGNTVGGVIGLESL